MTSKEKGTSVLVCFALLAASVSCSPSEPSVVDASVTLPPDSGLAPLPFCGETDGGGREAEGVNCRHPPAAWAALVSDVKGRHWDAFVGQVTSVESVGMVSANPLPGVTFMYQKQRASVSVLRHVSTQNTLDDPLMVEYAERGCSEPIYDSAYNGERNVRPDCVEEPPLAHYERGRWLFLGQPGRWMRALAVDGSGAVSLEGTPLSLDEVEQLFTDTP